MSLMAKMVRAANRQRDREWEEEFSADWEAKEQVDDMKDKHLKREIADLELEHRKLCLEQDIRALKHELDWHIEKRKFDEEVAAHKAAEAAKKAAANVVSLNGSGHPLQ